MAVTGGTLPEPARALWNAYGELLIERLDGIDGETGRWALGGGTILAKRWEHRRSFDLDITISESASATATWETVTRIGRELEHRGLTVRYDDQNRAVHALTGSTDEHGNGGGIDIWIHDPGLPGEVRGEPIGAATAPTLSTAQILHGKLQRDQRALIRDAYDIAHARLIDPGARDRREQPRAGPSAARRDQLGGRRRPDEPAAARDHRMERQARRRPVRLRNPRGPRDPRLPLDRGRSLDAARACLRENGQRRRRRTAPAGTGRDGRKESRGAPA